MYRLITIYNNFSTKVFIMTIVLLHDTIQAITTYNECQEELFGSENITTNGSATLTTAGVMVSLLIAVLGYILV